ncbi:unnamed protein product [Tenebrio molitor]|nr:unnamed protein product [Tenebrio molitor]
MYCARATLSSFVNIPFPILQIRLSPSSAHYTPDPYVIDNNPHPNVYSLSDPTTRQRKVS